MSERDKNRAAFPLAASVLDDFRKVFGSDVKLVFACESGNTIGKQAAVKFEIDGADFLRISKLCSDNNALVDDKKGKRSGR